MEKTQKQLLSLDDIYEDFFEVLCKVYSTSFVEKYLSVTGDDLESDSESETETETEDEVILPLKRTRRI